MLLGWEPVVMVPVVAILAVVVYMAGMSVGEAGMAGQIRSMVAEW